LGLRTRIFSEGEQSEEGDFGGWDLQKISLGIVFVP